MQFFSYKPRSGSRVLAEKPVPELVIGHPGPGTICAGNGVVLRYNAACPGAHWRSLAGTIARQIIAAVGGLAEDAQGKVSLVVPVHAGWRANELMLMARHGAGIALDPCRDEDNLAALLAAGAAEVGADLELGQATNPPKLSDQGGAWYRNGVFVGIDDPARSSDSRPDDDVRWVQELACPVRISDGPTAQMKAEDAEDAETGATTVEPYPRFAVRFGLYDYSYDRWVVVYADLHNGGVPIALSQWLGNETDYRHLGVEPDADGRIEWSKSEYSRVDANGDIVPTEEVEAVTVGVGSFAD